MPGKLVVKVPPALTDLLARMDDEQQRQASMDASKALAPELTWELVSQSLVRMPAGPFSKGWLAAPGGQEAPGLRVTNTAPAARWIEFPTKPHVIEARPGGVLAWIPGRGAFSAFNASKAKAGGAWLYAKRVNHPGTRGKFVFEGTVKAYADHIFSVIIKAAKAALSGKD